MQHKEGSLLRERNADRHSPTAVSLPLDDREHAKHESSERALDLDLLRGRVELEVLDELGEEGLHLDDPSCRSTDIALVSRYSEVGGGDWDDARETPPDARADAGGCEDRGSMSSSKARRVGASGGSYRRPS